ncbi:MAG: hypothetical protein EOO68_12445, partial [Moraxellaceae bacterium]
MTVSNSNPDQKFAGNTVYDNNKVSSREVEGLTDVDELSEELDKNPENALNEQGASNQAATQQDDGSAGNQKIRDAVEHL